MLPLFLIYLVFVIVRPHDCHHALLEVDVGALQSERLALAEARVHHGGHQVAPVIGQPDS